MSQLNPSQIDQSQLDQTKPFTHSRYTKEDDDAYLTRKKEHGDVLFKSFRAGDLKANIEGAASTSFPWIWRGYLARHMVSLLVSRSKSGKSTLINALARKLNQAGEFAGMPIEPAKITIVTEEHYSIWRQREQRLPFGDHVRWYYRPFMLKPTFPQWKLFIDCIAYEAKNEGIGLVIFDSVSTLFPNHCESNVDLMMRALEPLELLRRLNIASLIVHHPSKKHRRQGETARGSSGLTASVDITMELDFYSPSDETDRRRILRGYSRFEETPASHVIEWTADGADYLGHGPLSHARFLDNWSLVRQILESSRFPLSIDSILNRWPSEFPPVDRSTLWRWLRKAEHLQYVESVNRQNDRGRPVVFALPASALKLAPPPRNALTVGLREEDFESEILLGSAELESEIGN